ncbi:MAG: hypothetical protein PWQ38_177 [Proteiniphilum sp.]|jgi:hypothetical protein|nr:hypothetical protein [Proteiniphilum sp.]
MKQKNKRMNCFPIQQFIIYLFLKIDLFLKQLVQASALRCRKAVSEASFSQQMKL